MNFPISLQMVVLLMTMPCAMSLSEEIPLTCPDTARRELQDISQIFDCTPTCDPEKGLAICYGVNPFVSPKYNSVKPLTLTFKILEKVPESTANCVGLQNLFALIKVRGMITGYITVMVSSFDFNPLLAVGVLTADDNTSKTNRSCNIRMLSDVLKLKPITGGLYGNDSSFWDFSSPLFRTQLKWLQGISYDGEIFSPERLQNTSIQLLNVTTDQLANNNRVLLKNMPYLRKVIIDWRCMNKFHQDSFLGMPEMEVLIIHRSAISGIPHMIERMPKLKTLEISNPFYGPFPQTNFTIATKEMSKLKNLQVLDLKFNRIFSLTGKLPPLPKLRTLRLDGCHLSSIEESDFVGFPELVELTLSENMLTHLADNTFRPLKSLKVLNLTHNGLKIWPVLHGFSFKLLDMSHNFLSEVYNLGKTGTTTEVLNISYNTIIEWDDKYVFSHPTSLIANDDQQNELSMSHSGSGNKMNVFTSGSTKTNHFYKFFGLSTTQRANFSTVLHSESQRKSFHRTPVNLSLVNFYEQPEMSKSYNDPKIPVNNFENTIEYSSKSSSWVKTVNMSNNLIKVLSDTMVQSLEGLGEVDLGGNEFDCIDCRMIPFQKWLNTTSATVSNLGTSHPLLCSSPVTHRGTPVNLVEFDEEPCLEKLRTASLLTVIGVPVGLTSMFAVAAAGVIYKFRSKITYVLYLYKIRRKAKAFSRSVFNKYAFDAFVCYSSQDRRFVLTRLAPLLEKAQEQYCLCLHERDFPLGTRIVPNIVGSIQHSRKAIIVLSEYFINSKWCQWELEMAKHKMFNDDEDFLILIEAEKMDRNKLPPYLLFLMDTRTCLVWPPPGENDEEQLMVQSLRNALGPSIFQTTNEKAPLLYDVMEEYGTE